MSVEGIGAVEGHRRPDGVASVDLTADIPHPALTAS